MSARKPSSRKSPTVMPGPRRVELLFEIGAEEIPAGMLPRAVEELKTILEKHLAAENLMEGVTLETFGGPRRLAAEARGLIAKQADGESEEAPGHGCQAARSAEGFERDALHQVFGGEVLLEDGFQLLDGAGEHCGRNLFGPYLE